MSEVQETAPVTESPAPAENADAPAAVSAPQETAAPPSPAESLLGQAVEDVAPSSEEAPKTDTPTQSDAPPPESPDKPVEANEGEQKKEEASQSDEPAPLPSYEAFTLPEGFEADQVKLGEFMKDLGEFETLTKADHAEVQKFGQKLMDRYTSELQSTLQRVVEAQSTEWEKTKSSWKEAVEKDPEIGGNRAETTRTNIQRFLKQYGGTAEERSEFSAWMNESGIGNYPPLVRMIARAGEMLAEGRPLAAQPATNAQPKGVMARVNKMYSS